MRALLGHSEAGVRARAANLVGNLCRHSAFFYEPIAAHGLLEPLIARCRDPDRATRKFACFAIGNASAPPARHCNTSGGKYVTSRNVTCPHAPCMNLVPRIKSSNTVNLKAAWKVATCNRKVPARMEHG